MITLRILIVTASLLGLLFTANSVPAEDSSSGIAVNKLTNFDTDKDGKVSKDEYLAGSRKLAENRFPKIDTDGDGFITKEEGNKAKQTIKNRRKQGMQ